MVLNDHIEKPQGLLGTGTRGGGGRGGGELGEEGDYILIATLSPPE